VLQRIDHLGAKADRTQPAESEYRRGVREERERCAKIADEWAPLVEGIEGRETADGMARLIARHIRQGSQDAAAQDVRGEGES
jgi:hypothetical protein